MELTKLDYIRALKEAPCDPNARKTIEDLIDDHLYMLNHMKKTSLWQVYQYEEQLTKYAANAIDILMYDNEKLKKEVNRLRKQLGMIEKYKVKEEDDVPESKDD